MRQLFLNETATTLFFSEAASSEYIRDWIYEQVLFNDTNPFNLNEPHS